MAEVGNSAPGAGERDGCGLAPDLVVDVLAARQVVQQAGDEVTVYDMGAARFPPGLPLDEFALDFASLGRKVRNLPQTSHLLSIHNLLTDAVAREEGSMRALRNSWRPFTVDVFKAVDVERTNSDRLRRDANIALQELNERFP